MDDADAIAGEGNSVSGASTFKKLRELTCSFAE